MQRCSAGRKTRTDSLISRPTGDRFILSIYHHAAEFTNQPGLASIEQLHLRISLTHSLPVDRLDQEQCVLSNTGVRRRVRPSTCLIFHFLVRPHVQIVLLQNHWLPLFLLSLLQCSSTVHLTNILTALIASKQSRAETTADPISDRHCREIRARKSLS